MKDWLETTRFALADLNTKVKDLENEKACLITSLKILHQDYFQSNENGLHNKELAASSSAINSGPWLKPSSTCKSSKTVDSNVQISNRFESLDCEGDVEESTNDQNNLRRNLGKKRKVGAKGHGTYLNMNKEQKQDEGEGNSIENKKRQRKQRKLTNRMKNYDQKDIMAGETGCCQGLDRQMLSVMFLLNPFLELL